MPKNIIIFSDGTGQIGGLRPDQRLSNVYKMYRAMRPAPDSPISYFDQVAYYDPGLGAGEVEGATKKIQSLLESSVGAGIENNMIDCYEKIISYYETGDHIILIGFSRGAYTVRAIANMMNLCGIPTKTADGFPMPKDGPVLKKIATEAVKTIYGHGGGKPRGQQPYLNQREEKGRRFRVKYGCEESKTSNKRGNVEPEFVGVFDTVAALQNSAVIKMVWVLATLSLILFGLSIFYGWLFIIQLFFGAISALGFYIITRFLVSQIRYFEPDPNKPLSILKPWHWYKIIYNTHLAYWNKGNYDRWLSPKVGFARHALAIDEGREDFPRVPWALQSAVQANRGKKPKWLDQIWFAGCHSDIGGSYPEDESRLSDISLEWMKKELKKCVPSIQIRNEALVTTPNPLGLQHKELYIKIWWFKIPWKYKPRDINTNFRLHSTVINRLKAKLVPYPHSMKQYRPDNLSDHPQAQNYYKDKKYS